MPRNRPSSRYGHTLNLLGHNALVFGGNNGESYLNDLFAFDLEHVNNESSWKTLLPNEARSDRPAARTCHTMVSWDKKLYL